MKEVRMLQRIGKLKIALLLSAFYLAAAVITSYLTHSLALISEAGHMVADVGGLSLTIFAINYTHKPATPQRTYGFYRLEIIASLANSIILVLISLYILYEGFKRIFAPPEIISFPMIVVAAVGLVMNLIGMRLIGSNGLQHSHRLGNHHHLAVDQSEDLNIHAAYLESLSDTLGSAGVLVTGLIILSTRFYLADPIISIGLAVFILPRTSSLLKKALHILMQGVPSNISHDEVKESILQIRGVTGVFDLHIWTITSGLNDLSAHVVIIDPNKSQAILKEINSVLENKFKIAHATIQIETYHSESGLF
jgi:cobalt-zinc-cadmium efflux system protein